MEYPNGMDVDGLLWEGETVKTTKTTMALVAVALLGPCGVGRAEGPNGLGEVKKENTQLKQRVAELEKGMKALQKMVKQQSVELTTVRETQKNDLRKVHAMLQDDAAGKPSNWLSVHSTLDVQLYGYIKADAAWDSARTDNGNYARWVESEEGRNKDGQFNLTARQTRLGLKIKGPEVGEARTSGLLEIDFYGAGDENTPRPMMRHAYLKVDWPQRRFSILAGQTWDVISPLNPSTLNYSVGWWVGNVGYRRPQIRATQEFTLAKDVDLMLQAAVARTIGHDNGDFDPGDTGEDNCLPSLQGRAAVTFPLFGPKRTTVGFSGHVAKEEYDTDPSDHHKNLDSWSANLDVSQPVTDWLTVKGELFTGENMDTYKGGIGQGINTSPLREIGTCGGWAAASLGPWDRWRFNVGASVEAIDGQDVTSDTYRTVNRAIFGNVIYQINPHTSMGFEISQWHTEYKNQDDGDSLRLQTSFLYNF